MRIYDFIKQAGMSKRAADEKAAPLAKPATAPAPLAKPATAPAPNFWNKVGDGFKRGLSRLGIETTPDRKPIEASYPHTPPVGTPELKQPPRDYRFDFLAYKYPQSSSDRGSYQAQLGRAKDKWKQNVGAQRILGGSMDAGKMAQSARLGGKILTLGDLRKKQAQNIAARLFGDKDTQISGQPQQVRRPYQNLRNYIMTLGNKKFNGWQNTGVVPKMTPQDSSQMQKVIPMQALDLDPDSPEDKQTYQQLKRRIYDSVVQNGRSNQSSNIV